MDFDDNDNKLFRHSAEASTIYFIVQTDDHFFV